MSVARFAIKNKIETYTRENNLDIMWTKLDKILQNHQMTYEKK